MTEIQLTNIDATSEQMDTIPGHREAKELLMALAESIVEDGVEHIVYEFKTADWILKITVDAERRAKTMEENE